MDNVKERAIQEKSLRFLNPDSTWVWVLSGTMTAQEIDKARPLINRDMLKLGVLGVKLRKSGVLLVQKGDPVVEWCKKAARYVQGLSCIVLGEDFSVPNPNLICANTANFAIMYGKPTDKWFDLMAQVKNEPKLVVREMDKVGEEVRPLSKDSDPYAQYKAIVELVREWWIEPYRGLQVRDQIDIRPHRTIN